MWKTKLCLKTMNTREKRKLVDVDFDVDVWALFDNKPSLELMGGITERDNKN